MTAECDGADTFVNKSQYVGLEEGTLQEQQERVKIFFLVKLCDVEEYFMLTD